MNKKPKISEAAIQIQVVDWCDRNNVIVFATPNGMFLGSGNQRGRVAFYMHKQKLQGLRPGVPDLFFPHLKLFIELKRPGGRLSANQKKWIAELEKTYGVHVAYSYKDAISIIQDYM